MWMQLGKRNLCFNFFGTIQDAILLDDCLPRSKHGNDFLVTSKLQAYVLQYKIFSYKTIWPIFRLFEKYSYKLELVLRFLRTVVIYQNWFFETWILLGSLIHPTTTKLSITPLLWPFTRPKWINRHQCTSWPFCPMDGLRFFIRRRMGLITVDFFLLLTTVLFFSFFFVLGCFSWTWTHT